MSNVTIDTSLERLDLPARMNSRQYGAHEASFVIHRGCSWCQATGRDPSKSTSYDATIAESLCQHCAGRGHSVEYLGLNELYQLLMPWFMHEFVLQLPSIVERSKLEVIRAIMDS